MTEEEREGGYIMKVLLGILGILGGFGVIYFLLYMLYSLMKPTVVRKLERLYNQTQKRFETAWTKMI